MLFRSANGFVARCYLPEALAVSASTLSGKTVGTLTPIHEAGVFEGAVKIPARQPLRYHATYANGGSYDVIDPYSFGPVLGPLDDYYLAEGSHLRLFDKLGAHVMTHEGVAGTHFAVWAPNARRVSVVGDFNGWDGRRHAMRLRADSGVWEIFLPEASVGHAYKYEIVGPDGVVLPLKAEIGRAHV